MPVCGRNASSKCVPAAGSFVTFAITQRLGVTVFLSIVSTIIVMVVGFVLGMLAGFNRGTRIDRAVVTESVEHGRGEGEFVREPAGEKPTPHPDPPPQGGREKEVPGAGQEEGDSAEFTEPWLYLKPLFLAELGVARTLRRLREGPHPLPAIDADAALGWVGKKMGLELAATVDYLFGFDATARVVEDWMYERVAQAYLLDAQTRQFLAASNPWALQAMAERLLEAVRRGLWEEPAPDTLAALEGVCAAGDSLLETRSERAIADEPL